MEEMTHKTPGRVGVNIRNIGVNIKKPKYPAFMQSKVAQYLDWNKIFTRLNGFWKDSAVQKRLYKGQHKWKLYIHILPALDVETVIGMMADKTHSYPEKSMWYHQSKRSVIKGTSKQKTSPKSL